MDLPCSPKHCISEINSDLLFSFIFVDTEHANVSLGQGWLSHDFNPGKAKTYRKKKYIS